MAEKADGGQAFEISHQPHHLVLLHHIGLILVEVNMLCPRLVDELPHAPAHQSQLVPYPGDGQGPVSFPVVATLAPADVQGFGAAAAHGTEDAVSV